MKFFKLFEEYFDEKKLISGQFRTFVGSEDNVRRFLNAVTDDSKPFVQPMSNTQVRVSNDFENDLETKFEILDLLGIFGLRQIDLNSAH